MAKSVLDDRILRRLTAKIERANRAHVKVGILQSNGAGQAHDSKSGVTMAELAVIHEFGAPKANIPERSFIRSTFIEGENAVVKTAAGLAKGFFYGRISLRRALDVLGLKGVAMVRAQITRGEGIPPPLKPATIDRKGSDRPLVDTGRLVGALSHEVVGA